jgi:hypothetical protein
LLAADAKITNTATPAKWRRKGNDVETKKYSYTTISFAVFHTFNADYRLLMEGMLYETLPHLAPNIRTLAATVLFRLPLVREFALWTGCIDASRAVASKALRAGRSILVLPGGEAEQIRTVHGKEKLYLNKRKGFIKIALRNGVPIVPVYVFGASDYYHTWFVGYGLRLWIMKKLGICITLAFGLYGSTVCPIPVETTIVLATIGFYRHVAGAPSTRKPLMLTSNFEKPRELLIR